jgi:hypothetical protein
MDQADRKEAMFPNLEMKPIEDVKQNWPSLSMNTLINDHLKSANSDKVP